MISQLRDDPSISLAIENVSKEIPELADKIREKRKFLGRDQLGRFVRMFFKKGKFKVAAKELDNGSVICDPTEATRILNGMSKRNKLGKELVEIYNEMPFNVKTELSGELSIKKVEIEKIIPELKGNLMDDRVPTSIAMNFLYFWLGNQLLKAQFDGIRDFIRGGVKPGKLLIERLMSKSYKPLHRFVITPEESHLITYVSFFEWIVFKINFGAILKGTCKGGMFIEDLKSRQALYASTFEDHVNKIYHSLGQPGG